MLRSVPMAAPPRPRRLARALAGLGLAAALLLGVEGVARAVAGRPPPPQALIRVSTARIEVEGDVAALRHFELRQQDVVVPRQPGEKPRVVFLGESSVRNTFQAPPDVNFPRHVQTLLPEIEVVNFGMPGQSAAGILRLAAELAPLQPDLVVIYTGHNEFSAPVFRGDADGVRLWTLPLYRLFAESWIRARLSDLLLGDVGPPSQALRPGQRPRFIPADTQLLELRPTVLSRFGNELRRAAEASPAPVLFASLLRNFDHPPSGIPAEGFPACASAANGIPATLTAPDALAARIAQACGEDAAVTLWLRAHAARRAGRTEEAAAAWRRSLANDPVPIRAPLEADDVVREVAAGAGARFVDVAAAVPFPEGALFSDMLHPNAAGAHRIAEVLAPEIRAALGGARGADPAAR